MIRSAINSLRDNLCPSYDLQILDFLPDFLYCSFRFLIITSTLENESIRIRNTSFTLYHISHCR